ncbi:hypothetical protein FRX31_004584 [Thalictrum thalictroides]|uniref:Uncharacterized protein n=1 Tax=Thalictrum thalictroides TaxID=46969 RepID=A0A7J6X872_THATH|nr:hypothetical protein FRX31_004584 [Thalictrum thalictroides]
MMQMRSKWVNSQGDFETIGDDDDLTIEPRELAVHDGRKITNVEENGEKMKVTEAQQVEENNVTNNGDDQVSEGIANQMEMMEELLEGNNMEAIVMDYSPQPKIGCAMKVDSVKIQSVVLKDVSASAGNEAINEGESTTVLFRKLAYQKVLVFEPIMNLAELAQGPVTISHKSITHPEAHGDVIKAQFSLVSKTQAQVSNISISIPVDSQTPPKPFISNSQPTNPHLPKTPPFLMSLKINDPRPRVYEKRTLPCSLLSKPKQRGASIKETKKRL